MSVYRFFPANGDVELQKNDFRIKNVMEFFLGKKTFSDLVSVGIPVILPAIIVKLHLHHLRIRSMYVTLQTTNRRHLLSQPD